MGLKRFISSLTGHKGPSSSIEMQDIVCFYDGAVLEVDFGGDVEDRLPCYHYKESDN
jgi:hypothetical protein